MQSVCVFCGSNFGARDSYAEAARGLGRAVAGRGLRLVYGGSKVGLMGAVADAALEAGGEVVGVIPRGLVERELAHTGATELLVVETLHERKAEMARLSDGFIALPGGLGTLEELAEVLSWAQLGLHEKPIGLLDARGYWEPLLVWLDRAVAEGFVAPAQRELLLHDTRLEVLLARFAGWRPPEDRWASRTVRAPRSGG